MKIFYPTILLVFTAIISVTAQNKTQTNSNPFPTVSTLTEWASYNSQSKFDIAVRTLLGFTFEEKDANDVSTAYTYIRKVIVKNITYTDRIVYRIANDESASVISLVTASTDLVTYYSPQLVAFKRQKCDTPMSKEKNTTCSCYESANYVIDVCDERVKLTMGDGNKYFISVAQK